MIVASLRVAFQLAFFAFVAGVAGAASLVREPYVQNATRAP